MELRIELIPARMPMAVSFVETAAKSAGLGSADIDKLVLSVEELFMALCSSLPDAEIALRCRDRRHAVDLLFQIPQPPPDLRIFNITARPDHDTEEGLAEMGLYLASRVCDQFGVRQLPLGGWEIMVRKERNYPPLLSPAPLPALQCTDLQLTSTPPADAVKQLSLLIAACYAPCQFPEEFTPSGRLLDKLASGDYGVVAALDGEGQLAGGLIWRTGNGRIVECFGPYLNLTEGQEQLAVQLCESVVTHFGRSEQLGLVLYAPQQPPPTAGFEAAGNLATPDGTVWAGYCMLSEEFGSKASVPTELLPFYTAWSGAMALARTVSSYHDEGETGDGLTLFATRLDRTNGMARLTPLLVGRDAGTILAEHLQLFEQEGFRVVYCSIDTGRPFDALLTSHLLQSGFTPCMLVPWGGSGDLIQLHRTCRSSR